MREVPGGTYTNQRPRNPSDNPPAVGGTQVSQADVDEGSVKVKDKTCTEQVFCKDSRCDARGGGGGGGVNGSIGAEPQV